MKEWNKSLNALSTNFQKVSPFFYSWRATFSASWSCLNSNETFRCIWRQGWLPAEWEIHTTTPNINFIFCTKKVGTFKHQSSRWHILHLITRNERSRLSTRFFFERQWSTLCSYFRLKNYLNTTIFVVRWTNKRNLMALPVGLHH